MLSKFFSLVKLVNAAIDIVKDVIAAYRNYKLQKALDKIDEHSSTIHKINAEIAKESQKGANEVDIERLKKLHRDRARLFNNTKR